MVNRVRLVLFCMMIAKNAAAFASGSVRVGRSRFVGDAARFRSLRVGGNGQDSAGLRGGKPTMLESDVPDNIRHAVKRSDAFCFDVDSTLIQSESIDEFAAFLGCGQKVKELTAAAMGGSTNFTEALRTRLEIMRPTLADVDSFSKQHPPVFSVGVRPEFGLIVTIELLTCAFQAEELVRHLHSSGRHVYLVTGGFRQLILPIAARLNISDDRVFANKLLFDSAGEYAGFDTTEPTSQTGGKGLAVSIIKRMHGHRCVVMVGDGATDAEARRGATAAADLFIGYGGVVERPAVRQQADWFIYSLSDIQAIL